MNLALIRFLNKSLYCAIKPLFVFFFRLEINNQENVEKFRGPLIIVSNHLYWFDAFLVGIAMPRKAKIFPIQYACWHKYFYHPLAFWFLKVMGSFPVEKGIGLEKALRIPLKILNKKGVICLFPEGKRRRAGRPRKARRGAAYLAVKTNSPLLPVYIEGKIKVNLMNILLRRHKFKIKIGKIFYLPQQQIKKPKDFNILSNLIMEKIRNLEKQI